jgi:hypothetical protein
VGVPKRPGLAISGDTAIYNSHKDSLEINHRLLNFVCVSQKNQRKSNTHTHKSLFRRSFPLAETPVAPQRKSAGMDKEV